jgi:hypothetical protein
MLCALSWFFASILSPDAVGMAVGMLFGVLAGIPTALLVLAANRHREPEADYTPVRQPPVVVLYPPKPQPSHSFGWPEHISQEDEHLYTYELSAYGDSPRRVALPVNEEQSRVRRLAQRGKLSKLPEGYEGETPAGFRQVTRHGDTGQFEREEWS